MAYHSNLSKLYPSNWIEQFKQSILNQTFKDFEIYEVCYNGGTERIFEESNYESISLPTFIHAMNYLIEKALKNGVDVLGNLNVDDWYNPDWLKIQIPFIEQGFDIVSPNFSLFKDGLEYHKHHFENLDIREELYRGHNVLCHPAITYSRKFLKHNKYEPSEFPVEDLLLWKRTIDNYKFKIVPENLLYHRIHGNSVCNSNNR